MMGMNHSQGMPERGYCRGGGGKFASVTTLDEAYLMHKCD